MRRFFFCMAVTPLLLYGCTPGTGGFHGSSTLEDAHDLFNKGSYTASLEKYERVLRENPAAGDRILFEAGIVYAHPKNERKDYQKALECFQRIVKDYPSSEYRQNSETMMFTIRNSALKDKAIAAQQAQIVSLEQELNNSEAEKKTLQQRIRSLEQKVVEFAINKGSADKILIEKKERRLTLFSKGAALKTYKIALGGDPAGPKEREGDNKTPEGTYVIDARNKGSRYHLALHISYPNEKDRKRARELGVSPGGDIMIHGIKNGFSWVGDAHAEVDWTRGCIAVTDEEIEEIDKLAPNGTIVEITP